MHIPAGSPLSVACSSRDTIMHGMAQGPDVVPSPAAAAAVQRRGVAECGTDE